MRILYKKYYNAATSAASSKICCAKIVKYELWKKKEKTEAVISQRENSNSF